jgi:hypothetical protein
MLPSRTMKQAAPSSIEGGGKRRVEQAALFYEFSLEGYIPADHVLRSIDRFVQLGEHNGLAIGRPELMIRMLSVG